VKNPHAVALGRLGGKKGGRKGGLARAARLSPKRRQEIARRAAASRWSGRLPERLRPLFWEYDLEDLRLANDLDQVLLKVLAYGRPEHVEWARHRIGDGRIKRWIAARRGRGLTLAQMVPWVPRQTARRWQAADPNSALWENR
jgi:hypothetical protein